MLIVSELTKNPSIMPKVPTSLKNGNGSNKRISLQTKSCPHCGFEENLKGFASHARACTKKREKENRTDDFVVRERSESIVEGQFPILRN